MINIYLVVGRAAASRTLVSAYTSGDAGKLKSLLEKPVQTAFGTGTTVEFSLGAALSSSLLTPEFWKASGEPVAWALEPTLPDPHTLLYIPIHIDDSRGDVNVTGDTLDVLENAVEGAVGAGANLAFEVSYVGAPGWCRRGDSGRGAGSREDALGAIAGDFLAARGLQGQRVNVVIVDQGLDGSRLAGNFRGGWHVGTRRAGQLRHVRGVTRNNHGMLIARNILAVAPQARLYDCPLIPDRILDVESFLSLADVVLWWVKLWIRFLRLLNLIDGPWLVVNAWAIFDRATEHPRGHYSEDGTHHFNELIGDFGAAGIDVVFAAGNCGQFCPDTRCGHYDIGPGQSIFGVHAHESVLTVGALRSDGLWAGASSQGPRAGAGVPSPGLAPRKPDLCAPSFFADPHDAHQYNGGTSTACALSAGVIAGLRSAGGFPGLPTATLFEALRESAIRAGAPRWDGRLGFGMINAKTAFESLAAVPAPGKMGS